MGPVAHARGIVQVRATADRRSWSPLRRRFSARVTRNRKTGRGSCRSRGRRERAHRSLENRTERGFPQLPQALLLIHHVLPMFPVNSVTYVPGCTPSKVTSGLDQLATGDAMPVGCAKTKFSKPPGLVCRLRSHQRPTSGHFPVKLIQALDVPVHEVRVVSEFACWSRVLALTEHDPEIVSCQKTPSVGIDRISAEPENVHVVTR